MRIRIVSDGTSEGTKVTDEAGNQIENVQDVMWYADAGGTVVAKMTVVNCEADVQGEIVDDAATK